MYIRAPHLVIGLLSAVFMTSNAFGHNGAATFATPVSNIKIDGDLNDWPEGVKLHVIENAEYGQKPVNHEDLSGQFRVGYDADAGMLYVAVEVTDSSETVAVPESSWDAREGCSIYLDRHEIKNGIQVEQYFQCGDELLQHGAAVENDVVKLGFRQLEGKRVYEWQLNLGDSVAPGVTFGFDVDITDKDEDGSFTWMSWGNGTQKVHYLGRLGHLHLVPDGDMSQLVRVTGTVRLKTPHEGGPAVVPPVSIQSTTSPSLWTIIVCDQTGKYSTELPAGKYRVHAIDSSDLRVDESVSVECELAAGQETDANALIVPRLKGPNSIGKAGLLHQRQIDFDQLDEFVAAYQEYHCVPGVSLAIIVDGKIQYSKKYGLKNSITKVPLQPDTVFEACSLTKPVFAFAVNRLAEKGVLDFQTPLHKYKKTVRGYEDVQNDARYKIITAQHVLAHRTGFPNWRSGKLTIEFEPGKAYGYSGEGFELLGAIVSHLTGKSLVDVIDEEVFLPLGIRNAHLTWNDVLANRTATGHILGQSPVPKTRNYDPGMAHSLHIDAENYAKLLIAILRRDKLASETYETMLRQQFEIADPANPYEFPYGLGLVVEETPFGKKYSHMGVNTGWRCRFGIYDESKLGYVVFTNQ